MRNRTPFSLPCVNICGLRLFITVILESHSVRPKAPYLDTDQEMVHDLSDTSSTATVEMVGRNDVRTNEKLNHTSLYPYTCILFHFRFQINVGRRSSCLARSDGDQVEIR